MKEEDMSGKSKSSISGARSPGEVGEYWDEHDLSDHWEQTGAVELEVHLESSAIYFPMEKTLAEKLRAAAKTRGISAQALLDLWVRQRIGEDASSK